MCFHEKAVRSRWCLSPVLKCSVGTLGALCIHCVRVQAEACFFHGRHFGFASRPSIYNIPALALETVHSHTPQNKHQKYQARSIHKPGIVFPAYSLLLINYFLNFFHKCIYIFKLPVYRCKTYIRNCIKVFKFIHYKFTYIAACYFLLLF